LKIQYKENLKLIDLRENKINNFNELINIISYFQKLERLNIRNNTEINEAQIKEMKNKLKEKYKRELDILF